jgi:hypothetical protein
MANEFGELIKEIKRFQERQATEPLRKALSVAPRRLSMPAPGLNRLAGRVEMMTKSLALQSAARAERREKEKQEDFLKSLSTINDRISAGIASGNISALEACKLNAKLNHLGDRARAMLAARGR